MRPGSSLPVRFYPAENESSRSCTTAGNTQSSQIMGGGLSSFFGVEKYDDGTQIPDKDSGYVLTFQTSITSSASIKGMVTGTTAPSSKSNKLTPQSTKLTPQSNNKLTPQSTPTKMNWVMQNSKSNSLSFQDFELGRIIGKGLMGTVWIARLKSSKTQQSYVAIKRIEKKYITRHKDERHINFEREILMALSSNFCIKLFTTFQDNAYVYFAMELVPGGELFQRLRKVGRMHPNEARFYILETFSALYHIQSLGYCYRDLKPENVMIDSEGHCKLIDFGFSTRPDRDGLMRTVVGTPVYLSPEQLNGKFTNGYTSCCDFWSLGIFLFELMTGHTPYSRDLHDTQHEVYLRILSSRGVPFPRGFNRKAKSFISSLCQKDLTKRLWRSEEIRHNKYFLFKEPTTKETVSAPSSSSSKELFSARDGGGASSRRQRSSSLARQNTGSSLLPQSRSNSIPDGQAVYLKGAEGKSAGPGDVGDDGSIHSKKRSSFDVGSQGSQCENVPIRKGQSFDSHAPQSGARGVSMSNLGGSNAGISAFGDKAKSSSSLVHKIGNMRGGGMVGGGGGDVTPTRVDEVIAEEEWVDPVNGEDGPMTEAELNQRDGERLDYIWLKVNERQLVPPYIPRLSNDKPGDDKYFRDYGIEPGDDIRVGQSFAFEGF